MFSALLQDSVSISHSSGVLYLMIVIFSSPILKLMRLLIPTALLVTCARIPMSALQGDAISVISDPIPGQSRGKAPKILVSYGASVLWSLSVDDCQTWFVSALTFDLDSCSRAENLQSLISNFLEFWPRKFRILYNDNLVTAQDWPRILNLANNTSHGIRLALQMGFGLFASSRCNRKLTQIDQPATCQLVGS